MSPFETSEGGQRQEASNDNFLSSMQTYFGYAPAFGGAIAQGCVSYAQLLLTCDALGILHGDPEQLTTIGYFSFLLPLLPIAETVIIGMNNYFKNREHDTGDEKLIKVVKKYPGQSTIIVLAAITEITVVLGNLGYLINQYGYDFLAFNNVYFIFSVCLSLLSGLQFVLREGREALTVKREEAGILARTVTLIYAATMGLLGAVEMYQIVRWSLAQEEDYSSANHFAWVPTFFFGMLYFINHYTVYGMHIVEGIHKLKKKIKPFRLPSLRPSSVCAVITLFMKSLVVLISGVVPLLGMITAFGAMHEWLYISMTHQSPPVPGTDEAPMRETLPLWVYILVSTLFALLSLPIAFQAATVESREFLRCVKILKRDRPVSYKSINSDDTGAYKNFLKDGLQLTVVGSILIALEKVLRPESPGSWKENLWISLFTAIFATGTTALRLALAGRHYPPHNSSRSIASRVDDDGASQFLTESDSSQYPNFQFKSQSRFIIAHLILGAGTTMMAFSALTGMQAIPGDKKMIRTDALFMTAIIIGSPSLYVLRRGLPTFSDCISIFSRSSRRNEDFLLSDSETTRYQSHSNSRTQ